MDKFLIEIRVIENVIDIKTDEIEQITKEIEPYLVSLETLSNFLLGLSRDKADLLPDYWKTGKFVKIRRRDIR